MDKYMTDSGVTFLLFRVKRKLRCTRKGIQTPIQARKTERAYSLLLVPKLYLYS